MPDFPDVFDDFISLRSFIRSSMICPIILKDSVKDKERGREREREGGWNEGGEVERQLYLKTVISSVNYKKHI